jgi:hypothetical protein
LDERFLNGVEFRKALALTKLSLARNNLIIPSQREFDGDIPAGDGKVIDLFLQCRLQECLITPLDTIKIFQPFA